MSKLDKLKQKFWGNPLPADFSWKELQRLLASYGYEEKQGNGSRVKFNDPSGSLPRLNLHKRHPDSTLLEYQLKEIRATLSNAGVK